MSGINKRKENVMAGGHEFYNTRTGEIGTGMLVVKGSRFPRDLAFSAVFHDGLAFLSKLRLTAKEFEVFLTLVGHMEFENWVRITQATMAESMGLAASNFCRAVNGLVDLGVVMRTTDPKDSRRKLIRISPQIAWRGKAAAWTKAIREEGNLAFVPVPRRLPARPSKAGARRGYADER